VKLSLYEITESLDYLLDALDSPEGLDEEAAAMLDRYLDHKLPEKTDGYCGFIANLESFVEGCKRERQRFAEREDRAKRLIETMKGRLVETMDRLDLQKVQGPQFTVTAVNCPPSVVIDDESIIPSQVTEIRQTTYIDKKAIKALLRLGQEVPGARLTTKRSIRIK
jgi:hypothetical protein